LRLRQKRYKDADDSLSQALALREKFSQSGTPELAASIQSLAYTRKMEHLNEDAERLSRRAAVMTAGFR
jgi:hypothetical protein